MEFTEKDLQVIITALLKMPAEQSFDLLLRLKMHLETPKEQVKDDTVTE